MSVAGTPVDAELAALARPSLIGSANVVVNGSDFESPAVLGFSEGQNLETPNPARDSRVRWIDGFNFLPDDCDGGHIVDPCQLGSGADPADTRSASTDVVGPIQPFIIEASDTASTWHPQSYREARARRKLLAVQSKVLEAEFWSGTKAIARGWTQNQYLKNATGLTILPAGNAGAIMGIIDSLAALEQAAADGSAWGRPAIHASPRLVTHWISQNLVRAVPNPPGLLQTELGSVVIPGAGYPGSGPDAAIHTTHLQWAYVTPMPQIRLGEITLNQTDDDVVAVDRSTNDRTIRVARFAAVTFSPCYRAAVLVDMATALKVPGS